MLNIKTHHYSFGSPIPGRQFTSSSGYRYGFNGKENDNEVVGTGSGTQDYGLRIYNPALGKFLSVDPLAKDFPWNSTYAFAENSPIFNLDLDGAEKDPYWVHLVNANGSTELAMASFALDYTMDNLGLYDMADGMMEIADAGYDNTVQTGFTEFVPKETRTIITDERIRRGENQAIEGALQFAEVCNDGIAIAGAGAIFSSGNITYLNGNKKVNLATALEKPQITSNSGVGVAGDKAIGGVIKGYTRHGLNQAVSRTSNGSNNVGVKPSAILDAVVNPKKIIASRDNTSVYVGKKAKVVLNEEKKIVTVSGSSRGKSSSTAIEPRKTGGGQAQKRTQKATGSSYNPKSIK